MEALVGVLAIIAVLHFVTLVVIGGTLNQILEHLKDKKKEQD